jgi:hypothetical protein
LPTRTYRLTNEATGAEPVASTACVNNSRIQLS